MKRIFVAAFLFSSAALGLAGAQEKSKPCAADATKLCPGVTAGSGAQVKCLEAHKDELSPACKARIADMKRKLEEEQKSAPPTEPPPPAPPSQQ
jgi:hypothetical protein